jgi:hypothetical protein
MDKKEIDMIRKEIEEGKSEFCGAIDKIVPKLKEEIGETGTVLKTIQELKNEMGPKFRTRHPTNFYHGARLCLFDKGIFVEPKKKDEEPALLMRIARKDDKLFKGSKDEDRKMARDVMETMIYGRPPKQ